MIDPGDLKDAIPFLSSVAHDLSFVSLDVSVVSQSHPSFPHHDNSPVAGLYFFLTRGTNQGDMIASSS
jgi:hypothetical protein